MTVRYSRHATLAILTLMAGAALLGVADRTVAAQKPKYGVTLKIAKKPELAKIKTYSWTPGQPSFDKTINEQIRAAVDHELAALGITKVDSAPGVLATYYSLSRTDVDLKAKAPEGARPQYAVGTLVIDLLNPANRQPLFRVRVDQPIDADPSRLEATINEAVAAMFQKYPRIEAK